MLLMATKDINVSQVLKGNIIQSDSDNTGIIQPHDHSFYTGARSNQIKVQPINVSVGQSVAE